jgi:hypothetical protein
MVSSTGFINFNHAFFQLLLVQQELLLSLCFNPLSQQQVLTLLSETTFSGKGFSDWFSAETFFLNSLPPQVL